MPLIYALVARGLTVLCEFSEYSGNFSTVAVQCLSKVSQQRNDNVRPEGAARPGAGGDVVSPARTD